MKFKELLKEKKFSQQALADRIGKSQRLVSYWVNGKCEPQLSMVTKLSLILGVSETDIISCFSNAKTL
ncbi:MAG: helix-turn-helix transcriptional regulator [Carnobacterium sp.]